MLWTTVCWGTLQSWPRRQGSTKLGWSCRQSRPGGSLKPSKPRRQSPTAARPLPLPSEEVAEADPPPATTVWPNQAAETLGPLLHRASLWDGPPQGSLVELCCCQEKRLMLTFSAAAAAPGLGEACGELQMGISTAGTLLSSHSSPTTSSPRACRSLKPAPGSYKHNECQNKRRHRGEEGKWLPPRWDTSRLPKQQQIHNNEQFLKPILCLELLSDGGGSSSHACVKTKLWLGRDAIKTFCFLSGTCELFLSKDGANGRLIIEIFSICQHYPLVLKWKQHLGSPDSRQSKETRATIAGSLNMLFINL